MNVLLLLVVGIVSILSGSTSHLTAGILENTMNAVSSGMPNFGGGSFADIGTTLILTYRGLIITIATLIIVFTGFRMIISQEDEIRSQSKNIIAACVSGIVMAVLLESFVNIFFGDAFLAPAAQASEITSEVSGILEYALVLAAVLAVFFIVLTALRIVGKAAIGIAGDDDLDSMRRSILAAGAGLIILAAKGAMAAAFGATGAPSLGPLFTGIVKVANFVFGFATLAGVAVIAFAGMKMVLDLGNEEQSKQAKGLIVRVMIGILLMLISLSLIRFVITTASA